MSDLKLIALDAEDLAIISAHMQDAIVRVGDMTFLAREHRFAILANRFDWSMANGATASREPFLRRRAGLRFERVLKVQVQGFDTGKHERVLELLAIGYQPSAAPEGDITLTFAGGAAIRLTVECIEAELKDLGAAWAVKSRPTHGAES